MLFEECGGLAEKMIVQLSTQIEDRGLSDLRHQVRGEKFCDAFAACEREKQDRDRAPRLIPGLLRNQTLQVKKRFGLSHRIWKKLSEDRDKERARGGLEYRD